MPLPTILVPALAAPLLMVASPPVTPGQPQPGGADAVAAPAPGQQAIQDARAEAYVEAIARGDFDAFLEWHEQHSQRALDPAAARARFDRFVEQWGALSPVGILAPEPSVLVIDAATGSGGQVSFRFDFAPEPPYLVRAVTPRFTPPPPPVTVPADWSDLGQLVDHVRRQTGVPALAVGVYHAGRVDTAIAGVREVGHPAPARIDDGFEWASVGKSVTGTVIAALVAEGVLAWDSTIADLLPADDYHPAYGPVPLWMLGAHQAGVPELTRFDPAFEAEIAALPGDSIAQKRAAFVGALLARAPDYPPGTDARYSNGGFMVLGYLAERATGLAWEQLVQRHVFDPLGMTHSATAGDHLEGRVTGHLARPGGGFDPAPMGASLVPGLVAPAGGIEGSIGDLTRFAASHLRGLRGEESALGANALVRELHRLREGQARFAGEAYSFGWGDRCVIPVPEGVTCRSHDGGNGGFFAQLLLIPEYDLALTLLASNMQAGQRALAPTFGALLARHGPAPRQ